MNTAKNRLLEFLAYLGIGQNAFEKKVGIANGYLSHNKGSLGSDTVFSISEVYPELDINWLLKGEGEMLKTGNTQTVGDISHSTVGDIVAGSKKVKYVEKSVINHDEGKDMVIEKQEREVIKMFGALMSQLDKFHEITTSRDEYIKGQDEYISRIIHNSYLRNKENMERIDNILKMMNEDRQKSREQLDRLITILENKL